MTSLYIIIDRKRGIIMKKNFFLHSLPFRLLVGVAFGICIGLLLNIIDESAITTAVLNVVVTSKYILGQLISFSVPLIIIDRTIYYQTRKQCFQNVRCCSQYCLCFLTGSCFILCIIRIPADPTFVLQLHCQSSQSFAGCSF